MPGYRKSVMKRRSTKKIYKRKRSLSSVEKKIKLVSPRSFQYSSDELKCHITLQDNILYNNLTAKGNVLVNWAGQTNSGVDTTFRLTNALEFTNNIARFRWYKVHAVEIEVRATNMAYEFDTARTGGLLSMAMASSNVETDVNSTSGDAQLQQIQDYKEVPAPMMVMRKQINLSKFFFNHFNLNDRVPTATAYPNMWTGVRVTGNQLGSNGSVIATCRVQWAVSFYNRIPTAI